jgi:hypothetical protein
MIRRLRAYLREWAYRKDAGLPPQGRLRLPDPARHWVRDDQPSTRLRRGLRLGTVVVTGVAGMVLGAALVPPWWPNSTALAFMVAGATLGVCLSLLAFSRWAS